MASIEKVWYACYGSNLSFTRFSCYIQGGTPPGTERSYQGCTDPTLPDRRKQITIPHRLYFAQSSSIWQGKGVAFIDPTDDPREQTLGMMYLVTAQQFREVVAQENDRSPDDPDLENDLDLDSIIESGRDTFGTGWYSRILLLGFEEGFPILTFTNPEVLVPNPPGHHYLRTIRLGVRECYPMISDFEIDEYFHMCGVD